MLARRVEEFTLELMISRAREMGCSRLLGKFVATAKNGLVAELYPRLGFDLLQDAGMEKLFGFAVADYVLSPNFIRSLQPQQV